MLSKDVSSTILKVSGMIRPGIEPRSPGSLANTLPTGIISWTKTLTSKMIFYKYKKVMVRSNDDDTDVFDVVAGFLQGDTFAPQMF